jgi:large subunit ribosomal protein L4
MKVDVVNIQGEKTGRTVDLPDEVFGIEPNEHAVYLAVKQYLANQRQGTHKAKERNEIAGSTKKIKRQKGTGTARFGDIKNPIFRGGGRIFGPRPRNYSFRLNKRVKKLARNSVLSDKLNRGAITIVEDFTLETPRTREYANILQQLGLTGKKSLLVTPDYDNVLYLSSRNLPKAKVMKIDDLNTYEILHSESLLISEGAVERFSAVFV